MDTRLNEWFVPRFGSLRFRAFIGMLFLPYTGMCVSFTIIGSILAEMVYWDRVLAISIIYFLALGVGAHALDALGSKRKPWGDILGYRLLIVLALTSIALAYAIGIYYILSYVPLLSIIAILEGFFLLAYNLEWFKGLFHNNISFSISWGSLPLIAGYMMQTNSISLNALLASAVTALVAYTEIRVSRAYKEFKRNEGYLGNSTKVQRYEIMLKLLSLGTIAVTMIMLTLKYNMLL
jgi:hypothetical protein